MITSENSIDREKLLEQELAAYRARLKAEMGLAVESRPQWTRPEELSFTRDQRSNTTILFGGLTLAHEQFIKAALLGLGYKVDNIPCPDNEALQIGKENGNRGQCNPTYYTVGNLVQYLEKLRTSGLPKEVIERDYVFFTAGACGPCRFGMYEAEYRKALRESGFDKFRVLLFQQQGGLKQAARNDGIEMTLKFFIGLIKAMMMGDLINEVAYLVRPYEVNPGQTNAAVEEAKAVVCDALTRHKPLVLALRKVKKLFDGVEVDYTRVRPKVKITGEFWAQTTEGDGSYRMPSWLESEGAEVHVEPIGTWIEYLLWQKSQYVKDREGIEADWTGLGNSHPLSLRMKLKLGKLLYDSFFTMYRSALGFKTDPLPNMKKLAEYAGKYYNTRLRGGEGHLEIGKNIMAVKHKKAHMVLSLKPFGCMPSTVSDGVQSKVISDFPESIFLPIETSGDGEVNVKSRVQMKLYEAKQRAREEMEKVLEVYGMTLEEVRSHVAAHPEVGYTMRQFPHQVVGTASNFVAAVALAMGKKRRDLSHIRVTSEQLGVSPADESLGAEASPSPGGLVQIENLAVKPQGRNGRHSREVASV